MNDTLKAAMAETDRIANKVNDGGQAFPSILKSITDDGLGNTIAVTTEQHSAGMSLRDYFAAKAMPELLAHVLKNSETVDSIADKVNLYKGIAPSAYEMADAMIAQRQKQP